MIITSIVITLAHNFVQYSKCGKRVIIREFILTLLFLRPVVDAYRISTNKSPKMINIDIIIEMVVNKGIELATEGTSIIIRRAHEEACRASEAFEHP